MRPPGSQQDQMLGMEDEIGETRFIPKVQSWAFMWPGILLVI